MKTDILIIGAGLAGLALARQLESSNADYLILEARERIGGRILTYRADEATADMVRFDMGPAWFWPGQPLIRNLADALGLSVFEQYATGNLVFEAQDGSIRRDITMAPMAGSLRLDGGMAGLVDGVARSLSLDRLHLSHRVSSIHQKAEELIVRCLHKGETREVKAQRVVLALPPRLAASTITFEPVLPEAAQRAMQAVPTWMAGHAKVVAVYNTPFWREAGLSGDAISHRGPLAEIHDASPADGTVGALFGFVGVPAPFRRQEGFDLEAYSRQQLQRLFGPQAGDPSSVLVQDWANEPFTATRDDDEPPAGHPTYGLPETLTGLWGGRLVFGSSETAPLHGGFLEGAMEAADLVFKTLFGVSTV